MKRPEFVEFLRKELIPDLVASNHLATATDFETAVRFMENPEADIEFPYSTEQMLAYCKPK